MKSWKAMRNFTDGYVKKAKVISRSQSLARNETIGGSASLCGQKL
jgi:hypothetical protein